MSKTTRTVYLPIEVPDHLYCIDPETDTTCQFLGSSSCRLFREPVKPPFKKIPQCLDLKWAETNLAGPRVDGHKIITKGVYS